MTDEYGKIHTDGSRSGGQPVVAQQKALAVANNLLGIDRATLGELSHNELMTALVLIVQQSEAFKQKVSDAVVLEYRYIEFTPESLQSLIIPKTKLDPLVNVAKSLGYFNTVAQHWAGDVRAALDALGFEIREKGQ